MNTILQKILLSSKNQWDILYRISRFIEEENNIYSDNYWSEEINDIINDEQKIYYKIWHWLNYVNLEQNMIKPIPELKEVFNTQDYMFLWRKLENNEKVDLDIVLTTLNLEGECGQILLEWSKVKLVFK